MYGLRNEHSLPGVRGALFWKTDVFSGEYREFVAHGSIFLKSVAIKMPLDLAKLKATNQSGLGAGAHIQG
jgi:hypothetical protein